MLQDVLEEMSELKSYTKPVFRIVETQEIAATTNLVDDMDEQDLLEQMLETVKPLHREDTENLHYLISTPFRYPPLKYGSRFGDVTMPSYFYASEAIRTSLAECAFYRFVFMNDLATPYDDSINSEHLTFSVLCKTDSLRDLTLISDADIQARISSPNEYAFTQQLGKKLVENQTQVIRFNSARIKDGVNVAIAQPGCIKSKSPENCVNWLCKTSNSSVSFKSYGESPITFAIDDYYVDGELPALS